MGEENTFGVRRRAGSVADIGVVIRSDGLIPGLERRGVFRQQLVAHSDHFVDADLLVLIMVERVKNDDFLHVGAVGYDLADLRQLLLGGHDKPCVRVADAEEQVAGFFQLDRQRHINASGIENT